jgi:hypothetical protein
MGVETINDIFRETLTKQRPAVQLFKKDGNWVGVALPEFEQNVRRLSVQLRALGVGVGDRVAILSENRPEWSQADFAILRRQRGERADLPDAARVADRVHPERLGHGGRVRLERRAAAKIEDPCASTVLRSGR